jgi:hypothetical protein
MLQRHKDRWSDSVKSLEKLAIGQEKNIWSGLMHRRGTPIPDTQRGQFKVSRHGSFAATQADHSAVKRMEWGSPDAGTLCVRFYGTSLSLTGN